MSNLSELFTGFREFVDIRQDQLIAVEMAMADLQNPSVEINDFASLQDYLGRINADRLVQQYHIKTRELQMGNRDFINVISNANFNSFKPVLGDCDFV